MKYISEKLENKEYKKRTTSHVLLFNDEGEMAVVYIEEYNMYNLIGGALENGENPKEALIRETKEEIGYALKNVKYIETIGCYYYFDIKDIYVDGVMYFYEAQIGKKVCEPIEKDHKLVWVNLEEIIDKMYFGYHKYILNEYINKISKNKEESFK